MEIEQSFRVRNLDDKPTDDNTENDNTLIVVDNDAANRPIIANQNIKNNSNKDSNESYVVLAIVTFVSGALCLCFGLGTKLYMNRNKDFFLFG
eukprot:UN18186